MGFKPTVTTYDLKFSDVPGLEVEARGATLAELEYVSALNPRLNEPDEAKRMEAFLFFESKLISWNVDHPDVHNKDGSPECKVCGKAADTPLPPTVEGMRCIEFGLTMGMINGWVLAVARVGGPKALNSNGGGVNIPEELMQELERLQNPVPLPTPNFS